MVAAKDYPIYGVQFHPEKNGFEWVADEVIPHSQHAVRIMQNLADFFVQEGTCMTVQCNYDTQTELHYF